MIADQTIGICSVNSESALICSHARDSVCISVILPTRSDCITITSSGISHHSTDLSTNLTTFEVGNGFDHRNGSHLFSTRTNPAILSAAASSRLQTTVYWQNWAKGHP